MGIVRRVGAALTHDNALVRAGTAWTIGVVVLFGCWTISYAWLPERAVGFTLASQIPLEAMHQWNLFVGGAALAISSFFRVGALPLAYAAPWAWFALYGVALGTNSFALTTPGLRIPPQLDIAWTHVGLRELSAYLVAAAALADRHLWQQRSLLDWRVRRVRTWAQLQFSWTEGGLLVAALAMLASSAVTEAAQIAAFLG